MVLASFLRPRPPSRRLQPNCKRWEAGRESGNKAKTILQAMGSWVKAWEQGYNGPALAG